MPAYPTERIALGHGVHIRFSSDGRALYGGCPENEIIPLVEIYVRAFDGETRKLVEHWLEQKTKQVEQDQQAQRALAMRDEADSKALPHIRKNALLRNHESEILRFIHESKGIPEEDE
jgi:hypothetical protein